VNKPALSAIAELVSTITGCLNIFNQKQNAYENKMPGGKLLGK
jgi:hypothetical protein